MRKRWKEGRKQRRRKRESDREEGKIERRAMMERKRWLYNRMDEGEKRKNHRVGHGRCYRMEGSTGGKGVRAERGGGRERETAKGEFARVAAMGEKIDILIGQNNWNERTNERS